MNHLAFARAAKHLREAGVELEEWLRCDRKTIARWESGAQRISGLRARQIEWLLQTEENRTSGVAAGLVECTWVARHSERFAAVAAPSDTQVETFTSKLHSHMKSCARCVANEQWASENVTNPGPFPLGGFWGRTMGLLSSLPPSLVPAGVGAVFLGSIVVLRVLFATVGIVVSGGGVGKAAGLLGMGVGAVIAAAGAGAAAGLMIPLTGPLRRRLPAVGDYFTGVLVVWAYGLCLAVVAPLAFGEPVFEGEAGFLLIYGALMGLFGAYFHRREEKKKEQ